MNVFHMPIFFTSICAWRLEVSHQFPVRARVCFAARQGRSKATSPPFQHVLSTRYNPTSISFPRCGFRTFLAPLTPKTTALLFSRSVTTCRKSAPPLLLSILRATIARMCQDLLAAPQNVFVALISNVGAAVPYIQQCLSTPRRQFPCVASLLQLSHPPQQPACVLLRYTPSVTHEYHLLDREILQ